MTGVWILGEDDDPHTNLVAAKCRQAGATVSLVTHFSDRRLGAISYPADAPERIGLDPATGAHHLDSLWNRLKPMSQAGTSEADFFALRERRDFLMSAIACFVPVDRRLNDPWAQDLARMKPYQLSLARQVGLAIPKTIVTDHAERVLSFFAAGEATIYKPVTWLATMEGEMLFTNRIDREQIAGFADQIGRAPGIYQEEIRKACEYRVTIVDDTIFSVRVYSQERDDTVVDWRRNQFELRYEVAALPGDVERKLFELMRLTRLRFGTIDLIEQASGRMVFLEINPAGNWLWLEDRLNLPISDRIVSALIQ